MTRTHDIESDLEGVKDDVLPNLPPDERARAVVQFAGVGRGDVVDELLEATPSKTYEAKDLDVVNTVNTYREEALYALWDLETGVWQFFYERTLGRLRSLEYEQYPDAEWTAEPSEANGYHELGARKQAVRFLADYRAWKRYATVDVGVSLRSFLLHPLRGDAGEHVDRVEFVADLATGDVVEEDPEDGAGLGWASESSVTIDGEEFDVDDLSEWKYQKITAGDGVGADQ